MAAVSAVSFSGAPTRPVRFGCASHAQIPPTADKRTGPIFVSAEEKQEMSLGKRLCVKMIEWYQNNKFIHNFLYREGKTKRSICPYGRAGYASCSQFTKEAILKYGPLKGIFKGFMRLVNCNPLTARAVEKGNISKLRYLVA